MCIQLYFLYVAENRTNIWIPRQTLYKQYFVSLIFCINLLYKLEWIIKIMKTQSHKKSVVYNLFQFQNAIYPSYWCLRLHAEDQIFNYQTHPRITPLKGKLHPNCLGCTINRFITNLIFTKISRWNTFFFLASHYNLVFNIFWIYS